MTVEYRLTNDLCPEWLVYPDKMLELFRTGTVELVPWRLLEAHFAATERENLRRLYDRDLVPFAYRQDTDDLACFEKGLGEQVVIIHNQASRGWEDAGSFSTFDAWFSNAVKEAREWQSNSTSGQ